MTLSSLEIRNSWCLMTVLQVGAWNGVLNLISAKFEIIQSADCFSLLSFPKEICFNVLLLSDNYILRIA